MTPTQADAVVRIIVDLYPTADDVSDGLMARFKDRLCRLTLSVEQADAALTEMRLTKRWFSVTDAWDALARAAQVGRIEASPSRGESPRERADAEQDAANEHNARTLVWWRRMTVDERRDLLAEFNASPVARGMRLAGLNIEADGTPFNRGTLMGWAGRTA